MGISFFAKTPRLFLTFFSHCHLQIIFFATSMDFCRYIFLFHLWPTLSYFMVRNVKGETFGAMKLCSNNDR